ncbi:FecR family protein [Chitinophaga sp. 22321]|uniref:FecR domain-containing protein n=1 Tax=Chitinophaga hostae TaxID=2831022 RepID=A0ABS5JAW4_9BACT|nr:FecR domain-containing protein [Chitinophaga hostae]MBS0031727.1 FecR domain-containing protein [Chitinophaga hostae]
MTEHYRIEILMARKLAGEASFDELTELDALLSRYPEQQYAYTIVADINAVRESKAFSAAEEQQLLQRGQANISRLMEEPGPVVKRMFPWKHAVSIAAGILVVAAVYWTWQLPQQNSYRNEVVTKTGSKTSVVLPDGTSVVLNACSQLRYDVNKFLEGDREVMLTGEAFFDVKHDPHHPFIIKAEQVNIKVLGTVFNVKAYKEDATVETTLMSGKVEVSFTESGTSKGKVVVLEPEQKLIIDKKNISTSATASTGNSNHHFSIAPAKIRPEEQPSTAPTTAWMNDRFEFDKVTFEDLSHDLERWYNVTVRFRNEKYKNEVFTGAFRKQSMEEVLQALQLMSGFQYEVNSRENVVYIW